MPRPGTRHVHMIDLTISKADIDLPAHIIDIFVTRFDPVIAARQRILPGHTAAGTGKPQPLLRHRQSRSLRQSLRQLQPRIG